MYLFHNTSSDSLKNILKQGYLKSYSLLKKEDPDVKANEGAGIYTENNFVFFSCVDELFKYKIYSAITLYFNSKLLFNRTFYISTSHSPEPDKLEEWKQEGKKMYKRKYSRYYKKYLDVIKKLFNYSIRVLPDASSFQIFQQIAISNKVNLKELICIEFQNKNDATPYIIKYINKYYPTVEIKFRTKL